MKKIIILIVILLISSMCYSADSTRTRAELETIFKDGNKASLQNMRDFIKSTYILGEDTLNISGGEIDSVEWIYYSTNRGDINNSELVNLNDIYLIKDYFEGSDTLTADEYRRADADCNGVVNAFDMAVISKLNGLATPISWERRLEAITDVYTENNNYGFYDGIYFGVLANDIDSSDVALLNDYIATGVTSTEFDYLDGVTSSIQTQFGNKLGNLSEDSTPQLGGYLEVLNYGITYDTTPDADHNASGVKLLFSNGSGSTVNFGDVCYVASDGDMEFADASASATMPGLYMAMATITAGSSGLWLSTGIVRDDTWDWTPGGLIYVSTAGTTGNTLTQTAPNGAGDQIQIVGIATSADRIDFRPELSMVEHD